MTLLHQQQWRGWCLHLRHQPPVPAAGSKAKHLDTHRHSRARWCEGPGTCRSNSIHQQGEPHEPSLQDVVAAALAAVPPPAAAAWAAGPADPPDGPDTADSDQQQQQRSRQQSGRRQQKEAHEQGQRTPDKQVEQQPQQPQRAQPQLQQDAWTEEQRQALKRFKGLLYDQARPWVPSLLHQLCFVRNSPATQQHYLDLPLPRMHYLLHRRHAVEHQLSTTMNSLLAARRRLELLGQYMLDERGVLQEEAAAKEREGLAHLIQRQQRLLKLMTRVAEHAAAAEDAHYLGRHAGMMALAMEQDRLAKTYLSTNMRAVVAASKVNAALGGRPLTQEEELRRQQQLADCGMMVPTVPLNMLGEYRSVAVSFDCYQDPTLISLAPPPGYPSGSRTIFWGARQPAIGSTPGPPDGMGQQRLLYVQPNMYSGLGARTQPQLSKPHEATTAGDGAIMQQQAQAQTPSPLLQQQQQQKGVASLSGIATSPDMANGSSSSSSSSHTDPPGDSEGPTLQELQLLTCASAGRQQMLGNNPLALPAHFPLLPGLAAMRGTGAQFALELLLGRGHTSTAAGTISAGAVGAAPAQVGSRQEGGRAAGAAVQPGVVGGAPEVQAAAGVGVGRGLAPGASPPAAVSGPSQAQQHALRLSRSVFSLSGQVTPPLTQLAGRVLRLEAAASKQGRPLVPLQQAAEESSGGGEKGVVGGEEGLRSTPAAGVEDAAAGRPQPGGAAGRLPTAGMTRRRQRRTG